MIDYFYSIRLLIKHPTISVDEITSVLGLEPDDSSGSGVTDRKATMWNYVSWTKGERLFFDEIHKTLEWLQTKHRFVARLTSSGGELCVIAQLPGKTNIGSYLSPETMAIAVALNVSIGVEVFPGMSATA